MLNSSPEGGGGGLKTVRAFAKVQGTSYVGFHSPLRIDGMEG